MNTTINEAIEQEVLQFSGETFSTPQQSLAFLREALTRIANLAAAEEREACARAVEALPERLIGVDDEITDMDFEQTKTDIAAAIRARGQGNEKTV